MVKESVTPKKTFFPEKNSKLFLLVAGFSLGLFLGFLGIPWWLPSLGFMLFLCFWYLLSKEKRSFNLLLFSFILIGSLIFSKNYWESRLNLTEDREFESYVIIEKVEPYFGGYFIEAYDKEKGRIVFKTDGLYFKPGQECLLWLKPKNVKEYFLPFFFQKELRLKAKGYEEEVFFIREKGWVCRDPKGFQVEALRFQLFQFSEGLDQGAKGLFQALVLGVETNLPEEVKERLKDQGLYHLLAISGFNLAVMFWLFYRFSFWLLGFTPAVKWGYPLQNLAYITALPAAFSILVFSGFCPSAYRAFLFLSIYVFSRLFFRRTSGLIILFLTAGVILVFQPYLIGNFSFLLSFMATLGLILGDRLYRFYFFGFLDRILSSDRWYHRVLNWIIYSSWISVVISILLMPFIFAINGKFPIWTVFNNLLAGFFWSFFFIPGCILVAFLSFILPDIALGLGNFIGKIFCLYNYLPFWEGYLTLTLPLNLFCWLWLSFIIFIGIAWYVGSKKISLICLVSFSLFVIVVDTLYKRVSYFLVLDVGRANAMVFKFKDKHIMIDTGPNFNTNSSGNEGFNWTKFYLEPTLRKLGISMIDLLIISHPDLDHSGGFNTLKKSFLIKREVTGKFNSQDWEKVNLLYPLEEISSPQSLKIGETEVFLFPGAEAYEDLNRESVVVVLEHKGLTIFCPGDIDVERFYRLKEEGRVFPAEVLISPHHGSKKGINQEVLSWLKSKVVLTSGRGPYHPHQEVKSLLETQGIPHFSTAEEGTLYVFPKDDYFIVCSEKTVRTNFGIKIFFPLVPHYLEYDSCKKFTYYKDWEIK
ncbi:ComEC/Rec2 family competence protein [Thermodesulfobacterium thermophilum]|uniref:ComEC/Rec2 family competence protein n=1 Tax=Thermodesulfobacterium thermophilum TaxID=886 RepID=UPI0003B3C533|nr:ComEC/Rec2 family competence protein [Thermodesulfobacterium thermophilum]